jgi:hypothetical protein
MATQPTSRRVIRVVLILGYYAKMEQAQTDLRKAEKITR